jgi:hypothetical protein
MRDANSSWRIAIEQPELLCVAVFVRDIAGIAQTAAPTDLPRIQYGIVGSVDDGDAGTLAIEWNQWWADLLRARAAGAHLMDREFPDSRKSPELSHFLQEHLKPALVWARDQKRAHVTLIRQAQPWIRDLVGSISDTLERPLRSFELLVDTLPLAEVKLWPLSANYILAADAIFESEETLALHLRERLRPLA